MHAKMRKPDSPRDDDDDEIAEALRELKWCVLTIALILMVAAGLLFLSAVIQVALFLHR